MLKSACWILVRYAWQETWKSAKRDFSDVVGMGSQLILVLMKCLHASNNAPEGGPRAFSQVTHQ